MFRLCSAGLCKCGEREANVSARYPKAPGFGVQLVSPVEPHQLVEGDLTWRHTFAECRVGDRSAKGHRQYSTGGAKRSHRKPDAVGFVVRLSTDPPTCPSHPQ